MLLDGSYEKQKKCYLIYAQFTRDQLRGKNSGTKQTKKTGFHHHHNRYFCHCKLPWVTSYNLIKCETYFVSFLSGDEDFFPHKTTLNDERL